MNNELHRDKIQDKASEDSFPASDPPANTGITGPGAGKKGSAEEAAPTGRPSSDRYATETAYQREDEEKGIDAARDLNNDAAGG